MFGVGMAILAGGLGGAVLALAGQRLAGGRWRLSVRTGVVVGALIGLLAGAALNQGGHVAHPSPYLVRVNDTAQFRALLSNHSVVLVDFYAEWCGPCRQLKPVIHSLADTYQHRVAVAEVDVDQCRDLAALQGVSSIPDVRIYVEGAQKQAIVGLREAAAYTSVLEALVPGRGAP